MVKIGIVGVGHLGQIHLEQLLQIPSAQVVGFYDSNPDRAKAIQSQYQIPDFPSLETLLQEVDAVDIVSPTQTHYAIASQAIRAGKHVFIEKPLAATVEQGHELKELAREAGVKVQVGHVERFNPAFLALKAYPLTPYFIEVHRLAPWNPRGTDVAVILDLMIHDLDIILSIVPSKPALIRASGVAVISDTPDIANARIEFQNGCIANLTASRISMKKTRKMRIFQPNAYISIDFLNKKTEIYQIHDENVAGPTPSLAFHLNGKTRYLTVHHPPIPEVNAIYLELESFIRAIEQDLTPVVSINQGYEALKLAHEILEHIHHSLHSYRL
jgi:predicted dehydrogenase